MKLPSRLREQHEFGILAYYKHGEGKEIETISYRKNISSNSQLDSSCSFGYIMGTYFMWLFFFQLACKNLDKLYFVLWHGYNAKQLTLGF